MIMSAERIDLDMKQWPSVWKQYMHIHILNLWHLHGWCCGNRQLGHKVTGSDANVYPQ